MADLMIGYNRQRSTEYEPEYFVFDLSGAVIYRGTYAQCLVIVGAFHLNPTITLQEIKDKTNGFIN